jgi:uncharacterized protein YfaS (alpha-2-macroglobulin family)
MRARWFLSIAAAVLLQTSLFAQTQQARIESFSPSGTVKRIRQVQVRFSESMVPFGDLRNVAQPFEITCSESGKPRWMDDRNWVYDFDRDLPAGVQCEFKVREGLSSLAERGIAPPHSYRFSTGGPAILRSNPYEGRSIDENQIFILQLDADTKEASVLKNAYFAVDGISSRIAARIISGNERKAIIQSEFRYARRLPPYLLLLQPKQKFPSDTDITLVWGRGIASLSGIEIEQDQALPFKTRPVFAAQFSCERENPEAACVPISRMQVRFTAPVPKNVATKALLKGPGGKKWQPADFGFYDTDSYTSSVSFDGPFPELSEFIVELPAGVKDDAGRALKNANEFPLTVHTDEYPPLAKFAGTFGILELKDSPLLPVTLRNVEPSVAVRMMKVEEGQENVAPERELAIGVNEQVVGKIRGKVFKVPANTVNEMLFWIKKVQARGWDDRERSVFDSGAGKRAKSFSIPKLEGAKAFEVVGIPLKAPGFYVVELESEILGSALLGRSTPMYVPTTALVTNLSVHFKWGHEASLVWVTALHDASPVPKASVQIRDCEGKIHWQGETDPEGIARPDKLPVREELPQCSYNDLDSGLVISAQLGEDLAFVHTSWNEGIEPWRFQLPMEWNPTPNQVHTVFDRTLFRPGETVHMKHILRKRTLAGFSPVPEKEVKDSVWITHLGSEQEYELPLRWHSDGSAETTWAIPQEAKLGIYNVYFHSAIGSRSNEEPRIFAGSFRVEEYRVPLMKAYLRAPSEDLISPTAVPMDLTVTYLAGGSAGQLPVKFRYLMEPRFVSPPDAFEGFTFTNGKVKEGLVRNAHGYEEWDEEGNAERTEDATKKDSLKRQDLVLDRMGSARATISELPNIEKPMSILTELDFKDPNGEVQTASSRIPLWPSSWLIGIKPDNWVISRESLKFQVAVLDLAWKPVTGASVKVNLFENRTYSHRKRLVGGFYAYEHSTETRKIQTVCEGKTDPRGLLLCDSPVSVSGNVILEAITIDKAGRESAINRSVWVAGTRDWWFTAADSDRMDVLPENKRYEPGDTVRLQVRMPFRKATALITVEREGVGETFVRELSGKEPVVELPVKSNWAPNVFISVLVVRGRANEIQPTATVDLGRPAFRLGIAEIQVGWKAHELKVAVSPDRQVYKVREKVQTKISVTTSDGTPLPAGSEVAVAAVDEGLLELMPNESWNLLSAMMGRRSYGVTNYTAQMQVIGKRHFGLKALPQGGGGGTSLTRELFDALLLWKGRLKLDAQGQATVEIPLNDSLTSFRIVAIATGGVDRFGSGSASVRTSQDLILFSGLPLLVRQGDRFAATFTVRNATERPMQVRLSMRVEPSTVPSVPQQISLAAGESKETHYDLTAPTGAESLKYTLEASGDGGAADRLSITQKVIPAVPVRTLQATLTQLEESFSIPVEPPADAIRGAGGIRVAFQARLVDGLKGVTDYMNRYPYICLEQLTSRAISLRDAALWGRIMGSLPVYLDKDGLAKFFPSMTIGDETLTSYVLAIANEAGWQIPSESKARMLEGLRGFVEGRIVRYSSMPTSDLVMRKLSAIEALSREGKADPGLLSSITVAPNLWPTSAILDWLSILSRMMNYRDRSTRLAEAQQILRSRLNLQGTTMGFSSELSDNLWWLMVSVDANAVRLLLSELDNPEWKADIPRLVRGALGRQQSGHWNTTVANAWGMLAMEKFSQKFEEIAVTGQSTASLAGQTRAIDWQATPKGSSLNFPWPQTQSTLDLAMKGTGKPWATIQSLAAVPLKEPLSSGFKIKRTLIPIEQKVKGIWTAGDIVRVRLDIESQADMTWIVVNDPVPAGSAILGTGLGRDSNLATRGEEKRYWAWPAFEERSFEAYRAYYEYVAKGNWSTEYTLRLNNAGLFQLPPTRVEAMYAPEMFGELPAAAFEVK